MLVVNLQRTAASKVSEYSLSTQSATRSASALVMSSSWRIILRTMDTRKLGYCSRMLFTQTTTL
jgi:hypothetical protein